MTRRIVTATGHECEVDYYVAFDECAECGVGLFWTAHGSVTDGAAFRVESCACPNDLKMCCTLHVATYRCPDCATEEEEERGPDVPLNPSEENIPEDPVQIAAELAKLRERMCQLQDAYNTWVGY